MERHAAGEARVIAVILRPATALELPSASSWRYEQTLDKLRTVLGPLGAQVNDVMPHETALGLTSDYPSRAAERDLCSARKSGDGTCAYKPSIQNYD